MFDAADFAAASEVRAGWRADEEAWARAAFEHWQHQRSLADVARECMHRGDTVRLSFAGVTFTGAIVGVGTDIMCVATVAPARVDVALGRDAPFVLQVVPARGGGGRGDGTVTTFRARLRELDGSRVDVGLANGSALAGVLHTGVDHVQTVNEDGVRVYAPTGSVCWVRAVDVD
jgi:hypothetical protein